MSATHRSARPKGYLTVISDGRSQEGEWKPSSEVLGLIDNVQAVLRQYESYGPMTVRQIFYRLVGAFGYPKDERAYKRLAETLVKARRARLIPFHRIRDDGTVSHLAGGDNGRDEVWDYIKDTIADPASYLRLDRNTDQPCHIELWCEASGMAPMLAQMVRYRDVSVYSTGGFSSVTVTYEVAQRIAAREKPTYFLHVGDYDPSGESIFTSMSQDIGSFVASGIGGYFRPDTGHVNDEDEDPFFIPQRVALTESQVEEFNLPSAPPKLSDSRSANWYGETTQAEAMPPDLLEQVVKEAVDELTDDDAMAALLEREQDEKERLRAAVEDQSVLEVIEERGLGDPGLLELVQAIIDKDTES
jgi:hypothetical protein